MEQLIPITEQDGKQAVNARDLHAFLESKQQFGNWIANRIKKYNLLENQDFVVFNNFIKNLYGGRPQVEYALSLDCAKELAMVEGNERGKKARQYFIECEKTLEKVVKTLSPAEQLLQQAQLMVAQERRIETVEQKMYALEAKTATRSDYFTIVGYGTLNHISVNLKQASSLGRKASELCKMRGIETDRIPDPRFGEVKMYPTAVLDEVFNQSLSQKGGAV